MAKLTSTAASETITGGAGNDIVVFHGDLDGYILDFTDNIFTVADIKTGDGSIEDGTDVLAGVEKLRFLGNNKQVLMSQEAVVNIGTVGEQTETAMLATSNGGFYSFWASSGDSSIKSGDNGAGYYFRTFDSDGSANGADVRLLKGIAGGVRQAVFSDNSFILVWAESDASGSGVYAQLFNADGSAKIEKYRVNDTITDNQLLASVAVTNNGADTGFVVAWQSDNQGDSIHDGPQMGDNPNQAGVFMQMFDLNANPISYETKVGNSGGGNPTVTALDNGGFSVVYEAVISGGEERMGVFTTVFNSDGDVAVAENQVNTNSVADVEDGELDSGDWANELRSESKAPKVVTLSDGNVLYVWHAPVDGYTTNSGAVNFDRSIIYRILSPTGATVTNAMKANMDNRIDANAGSEPGGLPDNGILAVYEQSEPEAAALAGGGYVIVWQSMLQDNSYWGVYARMFDSTGAPVGAEFLVNTKTADSQKNPSVIGLSDGGFVISWEAEYQDGVQQGLFQEGTAGTEIVMQRYDASGNKLGASFAGTAAADDLLISGNDAVELDGAAGNDILSTSFGNDTIRGGLGDDSISGHEGNDILIGGDGRDTFVGGIGDDTVFGGEGADKFVLTGNYADYTIIGGNGTYTITDERVADTVSGFVPDGEDLITGVEVLSFADQDVSVDSGSSGGSTGKLVTGDTTLADILDGTGDNDTLQGGGNTTGVKADTLQGGDGDDLYIVSGAVIVIYDTGGTDTLEIASAIDLNKPTIGKLDGLEYIENVTLDGAKSLKLVGNGSANELTGNNGANNINGGAGDDVLNGGLGKDVLTGGADDDVFVFNATLSKANIDKITDFGNGSDRIELSEAFFANLDPDGDGLINYKEGAGLKSASVDTASFIIFDTKGGGIYYDAAGSGSVQFATLAKFGGVMPELDASDFSLI